MRKLDFISASPHLSIFKAGSNKTSFGGTLFLIYLIILAILASFYIYDYTSKEKYIFESNFIKNDTKVKESKQANEIKGMEEDLLFDLYKDNVYINESDNFFLVDYVKLWEKINNRKYDIDPKDGYNIINLNDIANDESLIKQGSPVNKKLNNFRLGVFYRCNGTNCTIREKDKLESDTYFLYFWHRGFRLDHQNSEKPIYLLPKNNYYCEYLHFLENTNIIEIEWKLIEYQEKKGIFSKTFDDITGISNIFWGSELDLVYTFTGDRHIRNLPSNYLKIKDQDGNHFILLLFLINLFNRYDDHYKYTRTEKSFLDVLSNISALGSTILSLLSLAHEFLYSQNYDNYKIIENILTKRLGVNIFHNADKKEKISEQKIELRTDLISNISEEEDEKGKILEDNKENKIEEENEKNSAEKLDLPSLKFFDFIINKFYFKFFGYSSKQSLINSCNDVLAKFVSIEKIVYNQMKLENLWNDYKWNNPQYEIKEKNDLVLNLKGKNDNY